MRTRAPISRRGSVGLAMVIVLVVLQLLLVGVIASGARDQDLSVNRLDTFRSAYATESGANMALREIMNNADEDGDGGIGTISNEGNAANDPALGTAHFYVSASLSGSLKTLTSRGRAGAARRQADEVVDLTGSGGGGGVGTALAAFGRSGTNLPRYSVWSGSAWGSVSALPDIGGVANFVVARGCPTRNETMFVAQDSNQDVNVVFYNGTSWGSTTEVCSSTGTTTTRPFDAAYELSSGDGLIVYSKSSSQDIGYRTYNGTTISSETLMGIQNQGCDFLALYPRPGTDTIILIAGISNGSQGLKARVWNGSSWGSWSTLDGNYAGGTGECFSLAYEGVSNDAVAVYSETGNSTPRYRTWNGASWSSQSSLPAVGGEPYWVRLAADPSSDKILFCEQDTGNIYVNNWTGSAWGSSVRIQDKVKNTDRRQFDVGFENGNSDGLVVYCERNQDDLRYRTWNGASWSAEQIGTNIAKHMGNIQVRTGTTPGQIFLAVQSETNDLNLLQWNGSSMSTETVIESSLGGAAWTESFMLSVPSQSSSRPRVVSWQETQPQ